MNPQSRAGTFSPNPSAQPLHTGISHSPHPSHAGALSAAASPSTSSPTGTSSLTKLVVAQVYLLLGTIKEDKDDPHRWDAQAESLRKLIDDHGMDVFAKYFTRLVVANAAQIFPGSTTSSRAVSGNSGNHHLLVSEMRNLALDFSQARKIAESIETGTEDIFRDFDLSTFMEHFKLDALEKTLLALAFKLGSRSDLKTKADAILSTNFPTFVNILSRPTGDHQGLNADFVSELVDRFIQAHPPNFNSAAKRELEAKVKARYQSPSDRDRERDGRLPPTQVLAALDLLRVLAEKPPNALALYIHRTGAEFTFDEETCTAWLKNRPAHIQLSEEQVAVALTYTTISQTPRYQPSILVASLRRVLPDSFRWRDIVPYFDTPDARITPEQFLRLYKALLPIAQDDPANFDIQRLWGGDWENPDTQLSYITAFASLKPDQLDATTIPGLKATFTIGEYAQSIPSVQEYAAYGVKHPLVSEAALMSIFNVALASIHASQSTEAKRLFQDVVVPNLAIFVVSSFGVPKPWPSMADETLVSLFDGFLTPTTESDFVLDSLWRRDRDWVKQRLVTTHAQRPMILPNIFAHAMRQNWLEELVYLLNGFGLDLTAFAHAENSLDLQQWARRNVERGPAVAQALHTFLMIKAEYEMAYQRTPEGSIPVKATTTLQVRTVSALLQILQELLPKNPVSELIMVQRQCITAYPRLINYGEGFDDIIDENGREGNALPGAANAKMEEHYKKMYSDEIQVRDIVDILQRYKHSRDPLDQDVFACMIHGLFDEYTHYVDYPVEALATTAVLFGGIISHRLISDLPLQIGLGMILEAVRDHSSEEPMYKFGLQALMQLFPRMHEWPGFCQQLVQIPALMHTDAWRTAEAVVRDQQEDAGHTRNGTGVAHLGNDGLTNGNLDESLGSEQRAPPFASLNVDPLPPGLIFEEPTVDTQDKIQFVLNNLTDTTLQTMFRDLREILEEKHQQWFASHLVERRAKMQPNYHSVYLDLVKQFEDKALWAEVLRETYVCIQHMLNSEAIIQNTTERTHLKNLGGWLGLLTLARDKPIKQKNIAFKQLLMEAHDTKRLLVVIPFVCKVLAQGANSNVFRPPNPWLMDIIHLLIELYHNADIKLNLKFEIEVLCKGLNLDHNSIQPSGEILNRVPSVGPVDGSLAVQEPSATFETPSVNGTGAGITSGPSPETIPLPPIPDLGPSLSIPQTEVVNASRLHEIVHTAITRALQDIIQPVVDRSVTIAAISTREMIRKDFLTEPDEERVRTCAVHMVKRTAGSLAQVTSKEPLRANFTNYMRNLATELQINLPEGIIIMCVNSNLEVASAVIEKAAEERAVPEIEDMLRPDMEARRTHRATRPGEPFIDNGPFNRWSLTVPRPFKLEPNLSGLNAEQMAIYEEFARQPRATTAAPTPSHAQSASQNSTGLVETVLQEYSSAIPTPAETPALSQIGTQQYPPVHTNGQQANVNPVNPRLMVERLGKLLDDMERALLSAHEQHANELPRTHPAVELQDAATQLVIKTRENNPDFPAYAAMQVANLLFSHPENTLILEFMINLLKHLRRIVGSAASQQIRSMIQQHFHGRMWLHMPLIVVCLPTDLIDWLQIDNALASALKERKDAGSIQFLRGLVDLTVLSDSPLALYTDFVRSLEEAWAWVNAEPDVPGGQGLKALILAPPPAQPAGLSSEARDMLRQEQMDYVFDEWIRLCYHPHASEQVFDIFLQQMHARRVITSKDDFLVFMRQALDRSADRVDHVASNSVDALVKMTSLYIRSYDDGMDGRSPRAELLESVLNLVTLVINFHHIKREANFNQKVFFRFFSSMLHEYNAMSDILAVIDREQMLLRFAACFSQLEPSIFPGFVFSWCQLIAHRVFLPGILGLPNDAGWPACAKLIGQFLSYLGELLREFEVTPIAKEIYQGALKLLTVLHHDYPDFVAANHSAFCQSLPPHATQLINMILWANPPSVAKLPDPLQSGLKVERMSDSRDIAIGTPTATDLLRQIGLLEIVEQTLQNGPSEDAIAQIRHAFTDRSSGDSSYGHVPLSVDRRVIDAVVSYIGGFAVNRVASKADTSAFIPGSSDVSTLRMLVSETGPECRYFFLCAIVNQLRFANAYTHYFSQALLDIFGHDMSDPEEMDVRQQIVRVLLERLIGYWPQPWGLIVTIVELIKNDKYMFFELPFVKSTPEVAKQFASVLNNAT